MEKVDSESYIFVSFPSSILAERCILDVWHGSEYTIALNQLEITDL